MVASLLALGATSAIPVAATHRPLPATATFRPAPCPFADPDDAAKRGIECGYLIVPEDRSDPADGTIELAVAVLHAQTATPPDDAVLYLSGGPGSSALLEIPGRWGGSTLRRTHDLVVFDQRGTGFSSPPLRCDTHYPVDAYTTPEELATHLDRAAERCRVKVTQEGVDVTAYDSSAIAADIEALRTTLDYGSWNLYGISYGTRVALEVMRDHPTTVRSAVLDAPLPAQVGSLDEAAGKLDRAVDAVLAACHADQACARRYPNVGSRLGAVIAALDDRPQAGGRAVDGHTIMERLLSALYVPYGSAAIPAIVDAVERGNLAPIRMGEEVFEVAEADAIGMRFSVLCREMIPLIDPARLAADRLAHPRAASAVALSGDPPPCRAWSAGETAPDDRTAVASDIPTLILSGDFDPITPPPYADLAAATLSRSTVVHLPAHGHGSTSSGCALGIRDRFVAEPMAPIDRSCVAGEPPMFLTDIVAAPGLPRLYDALAPPFGPPIWPVVLAFLLVAFVFATALLGWPLGWLRARRRPVPAVVVPDAVGSIPPSFDPVPVEPSAPDRASRIVRVARLLALAMIIADMLFAGGLAIALGSMDRLTRSLGLPSSAAWIVPSALAGAVLAATAGLAVVAVVAVRAGSRRGRIQLLAVVLAGIVFSGILAMFGVLGG